MIWVHSVPCVGAKVRSKHEAFEVGNHKEVALELEMIRTSPLAMPGSIEPLVMTIGRYPATASERSVDRRRSAPSDTSKATVTLMAKRTCDGPTGTLQESCHPKDRGFSMTMVRDRDHLIWSAYEIVSVKSADEHHRQRNVCTSAKVWPAALLPPANANFTRLPLPGKEPLAPPPVVLRSREFWCGIELATTT